MNLKFLVEVLVYKTHCPIALEQRQIFVAVQKVKNRGTATSKNTQNIATGTVKFVKKPRQYRGNIWKYRDFVVVKITHSKKHAKYKLL